MSKEERLSIGKIIGLHGVRGEVKVLVYGDMEDFTWKEVFLAGGGVPRILRVEGARRHKGFFLVKLEGLDTRDAAGKLVGFELQVPRGELPELSDEEYYYFDLEGLEVWTDENKFLGRVVKIFPTGSNDVFEVKGPLGDVLIPAIEDVVREVDLEGKRITVHLLEGLIPEEKKKKR